MFGASVFKYHNCFLDAKQTCKTD